VQIWFVAVAFHRDRVVGLVVAFHQVLKEDSVYLLELERRDVRVARDDHAEEAV
jgi:hypothetical protein